MGVFIDLTPAEIGINGVDLKADATTDYDSGILNLEGYKSLSVVATIDNTGGGANGTAALRYRRYDKNGNAVGDVLDLATAINTKADETCTVSVSEYQAGEADGGTIGTLDRLVLPLGRCKITLRVTEANNGTSCYGYVRLYAQ